MEGDRNQSQGLNKVQGSPCQKQDPGMTCTRLLFSHWFLRGRGQEMKQVGKGKARVRGISHKQCLMPSMFLVLLHTSGKASADLALHVIQERKLT